MRILRGRPSVKIVLGAGNLFDKGWILTDINTLNVLKKSDWDKFTSQHKIRNLFAEHVWEHLTDEEAEIANRNCFNNLKRTGVFRIAVPDGFHPDQSYIEATKPGGSGDGAQDHKIHYNYRIMKERLEQAGFKVKLLEYWDEQGNFHAVDWTDEGGRVRRSKRYDPRNVDGKLNYTSLIIDAVKPLW